MHRMIVLYNEPKDPAHFKKYYVETHVPLANKIPGLTTYTWRHCASLDDAPPPYYLLAELSFPSEDALKAGLASPEGQTAAADVPNFATGGVTMFVAHD